MGVIIGMMIGGFIGMSLMCLVRINKRDAVTVVKKFEGAIEHERVAAIKEKKNKDYIDGMTRIIMLFRNFFSEELEDKR